MKGKRGPRPNVWFHVFVDPRHIVGWGVTTTTQGKCKDAVCSDREYTTEFSDEGVYVSW